MLGRDVPGSEREAQAVLTFYREYGSLPREAFEAACARSNKSLGGDRPLTTYLKDLERQIGAERDQPDPDDEETT